MVRVSWFIGCMAKRLDAGSIALDDLESAGALVLACKTCTVSKDQIPTTL